MTPEVTVAEERARLAAADLLAAANELIARLTMKPENTQDDVDAAVLSRRLTSYALSRRLDDARADADFANSARTDIGRISTSLRSLPDDINEDATAGRAELIGRLNALAADCERRAVLLRS
jgi:hypothetical protein